MSKDRRCHAAARLQTGSPHSAQQLHDADIVATNLVPPKNASRGTFMNNAG
jgi:hypothetical protein